MPWTYPCFLMYFLFIRPLWLDMGILGSYLVLILKKISPEYSLDDLMLKLKLQYFGHLM